MAVWQFGIYFIPNAVAQTHRISTGMTVSAVERELITEWDNSALPSEELRQLRLILPGDLESTCVTFHKENHSVISIYARFDLRTFSIEVVNAVMKLASTVDCLLLTDDNKVISPSISDLKAEIKGSSASRFARDPKGFIAGLSKAS